MPSDPSIQYFGRVDHSSPDAPAFSWVMAGVGGSVFASGFDGVSVVANFSTPSDGARLAVSVDGGPPTYLSIAKGGPDAEIGGSTMATHTLIDNLPNGNRTVQVLKVSEDNSRKKGHGVMTFGGFGICGRAVQGGALAHWVVGDASIKPTHGACLSPPCTRRLEFIGDSDTAGWCADGSVHTGDNADKYEDATQTWAQHIAANVSAEVMVEAISGYGVMARTPAIQPVMDYTLGFDAAAGKWNYTTWVPDAVVILIGPNDEVTRDVEHALYDTWAAPKFHSTYSSSKFIADYTQMLTQIDKNYRGALTPPKLIHVCGGSLNGLDPCDDIKTAIKHWNAKGKPTRSFFTTIQTSNWNMINGCSKGSKHCSGKSSYNGCDGHYNTKGHAVLAADILPQLRQIMSW